MLKDTPKSLMKYFQDTPAGPVFCFGRTSDREGRPNITTYANFYKALKPVVSVWGRAELSVFVRAAVNGEPFRSARAEKAAAFVRDQMALFIGGIVFTYADPVIATRIVDAERDLYRHEDVITLAPLDRRDNPRF